MAEYQLAEERLISGKGVLKVSVDKDNFRHAYLILDVIRDPSQPYLNNNWNPPRAKYAFLTFRRNEYVIGNAYMEWERQMYDSVPDITSQNLIAIKCQYQGVLQSFANLGVALGVTPTSITDLIKDYESLSLQWDEVLIKCYADTAIQARLFYLLDDTCNEESRRRKRIPLPPPPLPKVPPRTPITNISQPYDPGTSDSGNTEPYPEDEIEVLQGQWTITWTYVQTPGLSPCPYLGTPDVIIRPGLSTDEFGLIDQGTEGQRIWRLTQNGVPDPTALVEYRCTPTFDPPPLFELVP